MLIGYNAVRPFVVKKQQLFVSSANTWANAAFNLNFSAFYFKHFACLLDPGVDGVSHL
jgi:hypothetical protein